jgi:hypothetical protein
VLEDRALERRQHRALERAQADRERRRQLVERSHRLAQRLRQRLEQRHDLGLVPARDGPCQHRRIQLRQERERHRDRDAVVVLARIEPVVERQRGAAHHELIRIALRRELVGLLEEDVRER